MAEFLTKYREEGARHISFGELNGRQVMAVTGWDARDDEWRGHLYIDERKQNIGAVLGATENDVIALLKAKALEIIDGDGGIKQTSAGFQQVVRDK